MQTAVNWDAIESPLELARALWTPEGWALPPGRFRALFDRVYSSTSELECLWQLGGASNDYLRAHPEAIDVPRELPLKLLRSDDVEARVIGLKLLGRCQSQSEEIVEEIVRALEVADTYEGWGGLYELGELLEKLAAGNRVISPESCERLAPVLRSLSLHQDSHTRETAQRHLDSLGELQQMN